MCRGPTPRDAPHAMTANGYMGEPHRGVPVEGSEHRGNPARPSAPAPVDVVMGRFDRFVRRGFVDVLRDHEDEVRVVAANLSDDAFEATVLSGRAAVAVMDQSALPGLALRLRAARPDVGLVVLVGKPAVPYGMALFAWGVSCLDLDTSSADVLHAVRLAADGGCLFAAPGERIERHPPTDGPYLTDRETTMLRLLSEGKVQDGEIAEHLGISTRTVRAHRATLREKLRARTRHELRDVPILAPDTN